MALAAGAFIRGRYRVLHPLGAGTYGDVYLAEDTHQGFEVAVKLMKIQGRQTWEEAQRLTQLESDYVLRIRNADLDAGVPFLATDVAQHGAADTAMKPVGVDPKVAVRWARDACRGTTRAHAAGLVHRDIKPANVFLTATGGAQLGDFGLAALMNANGQADPIGTPVTRAPEVVPGGSATVRSDVFSLGATLYALLAGEYSLVLGDPPLRDVAPHTSLALARHVHRAMAHDPADRFSDPAAFGAALGSLPTTRRAWKRTDEHGAAHARCFRGQSSDRRDVTVCLIPTTGGRAEVVAQHTTSGRRVTSACRPEAPPSQHPRNLRTAMAAAS